MTKSDYIISIKLGDKVLEGSGETALEALQSIPKPEKIVSKGILTISKGEKTREILYTPIRLKRLFYPSAQVVLSKNLAFGLD